MADVAPTITDWITSGAAVVTALAIILQYQMWKEQKRQNDLQSKPRLRLKAHTGVRLSGKENLNDLHRLPRVDFDANTSPKVELFDDELEEEWKSHVQTGGANLSAIPNEETGFIVENIGGVLATALRIKVKIVISGNPSDQTVGQRQYEREHDLEIDVPPGKKVFISVLRCRFIFQSQVTGRIAMVRDPLGIEEVYKDKLQPPQVASFRNDALMRALSAPREVPPLPGPKMQ